ncbi:MAG: hypothetical protein M3P38_09980 [Chloroflexota bacterium]|nr:hypothetical protein [Chloroflexota bacterium]
MTLITVVRRLGRRRVRFIAAALVTYGAIGLLLSIALAIAIAPALAGIDALARSSIDARHALSSTRDAFDGFAVSLVDARTAAERAAASARSSAATARRLGDAMSLSVFGAQPLLSIASDFRRQGQDLDDLAVGVDQLAAALARNELDVRVLRDDVSVLRDRVAALDTVSVLQAAPVGIVLLLVVAWFAIQALAFLIAGVALWRRAPPR